MPGVPFVMAFLPLLPCLLTFYPRSEEEEGEEEEEEEEEEEKASLSKTSMYNFISCPNSTEVVVALVVGWIYRR